MKTVKVADLFCGLGGLSHGLSKACERRGLALELVAVNHWPLAIETHRLNHPNAIHFCEDLNVAPPRKCVPGNHLDLLIAAPSCVHHSNARGGRPRNEEDRASAWCILRWMTELSVDQLLLENVPEFRTWGPLDANGKPIKSQKGKYFMAFLRSIEELGYTAEWRILNCADMGDATIRRRFFLRAVRIGQAITWPEPRYADPERLAVTEQLSLIALDRKPWRTARNDVIDWTRQGKSIFRRKKPLARKTLERIYAGLEQFGGPHAAPYLQALRWYIDKTYGEVASAAICEAEPSAAEPCIVEFHSGEGSERRCRSIDVPLGTQDTSNRYGLAEPCLVVLRNNCDGASVDAPVPALCSGANHVGIAEPVLIGTGGPSGSGNPQTIDRPIGTVIGENHKAIAEPTIIEYYGNGAAQSVDGPLPTVTTKDRFALAEPFILPHETFDLKGADSIDRPLRTIRGGSGHNITGLVEPVIVPNFGERDGQTPRAQSIDAPLPAVTGHGAGMLAEPSIICVTHGNGSEAGASAAKRRALSVDRPIPTVTGASRGEIALAEPVLMEGEDDTAPFIVVMPDGRCFGIDINLRMLHYTELQRAHSLPPEEYKLLGTVSERVKMIGNSVPAETGEALCFEALGVAA